MNPESTSPATVPDRGLGRSRVLKYFGAISILTAPVFAFVYAGLGARHSSIVLVSAIPFLASAFLVQRLTRSTVIAGNWILLVGYALFFVIAYLTGGIDAPVLTWTACIPLIAVLMCGFRSAFFWAGLVTVQIGALYWLDLTAYPLVQEFSSKETVDAAYFATYIGLTFFVFLLGALSEQSKNRYIRAVEKSHADLKEALEKAKTLKGLLPICAWCKKVRDDKGYWAQVEVYFGKHTDAEFSHGICPDCEKRLVEREGEV